MALSREHAEYVVNFTKELHGRAPINGTGLEEFLDDLMRSSCGSYWFTIGSDIIGKIHVSPEVQTITFGHELIGEDVLIPYVIWRIFVGDDERRIYLHNNSSPDYPVTLGFANVPIFREGSPSLSVDAFMAHYLSKVMAGLEYARSFKQEHQP